VYLGFPKNEDDDEEVPVVIDTGMFTVKVIIIFGNDYTSLINSIF